MRKTLKVGSMMSQRKPVVLKNSRHVDGIKEMIDFVRNQQGTTIARETTNTDFRLQRRAPLPGIGENNAESRYNGLQRPMDMANSLDTDNATDTDPAYESDNDLEWELNSGRRRTPSPPCRNASILSSKSTHKLGLSQSSETTLIHSHPGPPKNSSSRRHSLRDQELPVSRKPVSRTLPPMQQTILPDRPSAPIPHLDLTHVPVYDEGDGQSIYRPGAPSPASSRSDEDSLAEDGGPIDFIDSR